MTIRRIAFAAALLAATCLAGTAQAQDRHDHWHGDIHHFRDHDFDFWRGGHWFHGPHGGRAGWWWVVGGSWYFYPAPIYPYPDPYVPPAVLVPAPPPGAPPAQYWYYCANPAGYYPYVAQCATPWQPVAQAR